MSPESQPFVPKFETSKDAEKETSAEAHKAAVDQLATAFHEQWRSTRLNEDGSYEPRVKSTSDQAWIEKNGTDQVDSANTTYPELPEDWQTENKNAADVVVGIIDAHDGAINLDDAATRSEIGATVHDAWLSRNEWAKGGDLDVPFDELPADEQAKDLDQVATALDVFSE